MPKGKVSCMLYVELYINKVALRPSGLWGGELPFFPWISLLERVSLSQMLTLLHSFVTE